MPPILILVESLATLLWCYAGLTLLAWMRGLRRVEQRARVAAVTELLGHLVPAMIGLVGVVLIGALVGLPSVVILIAVLFPAGLAYGAHLALRDQDEEAAEAGDTRPDHSRALRRRLAATAGLALAVITWRALI